MKYFLLLFASLLLFSCDNDDPTVYTGNQFVYGLGQASDLPISGTVTIVDRTDGQVELRIELKGTESGISHPAHLHFGNMSTPDAVIAKMLTPVNGATGTSVSIFNNLSDESTINYASLIQFDGHIKVHLDDGAEQDIILAAGNIGAAAKTATGGRQTIAVCKSE